MREALSNLQEHLPSVDMDAVRNHLPSLKDVDPSAITKRVRSKAPGKRTVTALVVGLIAAAAAAVGYVRSRRQPMNAPTLYTPPLPKP
jgi:hypothetical protein